MKNSMKILFVIIGTLVGAGFASGKEIYSFFFIYGPKGIIGIFISGLIISLTIYKVLKICYENKITKYEEFCKYIGSNQMSNIVNIFLLITFFIMIAGFSSFLKQEFNVNLIIGSLIIIVMCYFTLLKNINGLIKVSDYLIPILIIFLVIISSKNLNIIHNYNNIFNSEILPESGGIIKSILYACYNCILLIPVLVTLIKFVKNKKNIVLTVVANFFVITILSFCVYNLLLLGNENIFNLEMPIIEIVKKYGNIYKNIYMIMIAISIFTTAISTGYSFLSNSSVDNKSYKRNLVIISVLGIFLSQISFSVLVNLLYPVLGVVGIVEIVLIFFK